MEPNTHSEGTGETMVDPDAVPESSEVLQEVEASEPEPCVTSENPQVTNDPEEDRSSNHVDGGSPTDKEGSRENRTLSQQEEKIEGGKNVIESDSNEVESKEWDSSKASKHRRSVVLTGGESLQGETDVDVANSAKSGSKEDLDNTLDNLNDISLSADELITSSFNSSSSLEDSSIKISSTSENSTKTSSATFHTHSKAEASGKHAPEASQLSSAKGKEEINSVISGTCPVDDSISPQADNDLSELHNGSGDASESFDTNNQNPHLGISGELENGVSTHEPFSLFVDKPRLFADYTARAGEPSGNTQEQELRSLLQRLEDSHSRKNLKKLLRSSKWSPTSSVRKVAWYLLCSHFHKLEKAYVYVQMEKEMFGDCEDEDVPVPTWPQQPAHEESVLTEYYLNAKGKNTAHKIVAVIGQLSPDITYSPGLLPLVDLFLHYMDAADCFSCVLTLLQSTGLVYLSQSRVAFEASKRVLRDLTKKYAKSAYVNLVRSCNNVDVVFDHWMGWIYSDLPFNYVVAVTDSYLMEGIKVFYRVVLAILILFTKHTGHGKVTSNVAQSISEFCRHPPVSPSKLLRVAFRIRGFSRRKIFKLQNRHEGLISSGAVSSRPDMPRVATNLSMGELSTAVSMAHANTKMMGLHDTGSNILSVDQLVTLWNWLPPRHSINQPVLLFNSADLGTSLMTLYAYVENEPCSIIVIKTVDGEVFGAFCAESWNERKTHCRPVRFFGTGETFLFTLVPERIKYEWVGKPDPHVPLSANMFQAGDHNSLLIGGGNGTGILLDGMMERCRTETCNTFNNPPLCPSEDFIPAAVEVFGLQ